MNKPYAIQDVMLNQLCKKKVACTMHLVNGYQLHGHIAAFDPYVIMFNTEDDKQMMIFKHAISSITPSKAIPMEEILGADK